MSESATSAASAASASVTGALAGWKAIGGAAGAIAGGAGLAAVVVMCMTLPRSSREWTVGLISTVLGSVAGGAFVIQHFNLHAWMDSYLGLLSVLGLTFSCGLPAWAIVRWVFTWMERRRDKDIA
jgi:hypothetical protein